jgi:hypothetical protein
MDKSTSSRNGLPGWWLGEEEMEQQGMVLKPRSKQNLFMQLPDCPVCWDGFDDGPRMPRLLHCGHTICQVLIDDLKKLSPTRCFVLICVSNIAICEPFTNFSHALLTI